ncbi:C-type Lectin CRL-like [Lissotriton helveticus]
MKSLLILFTLLGLGACRTLEILMEDAVVEAPAPEPCEKMNLSDTTRCPVCGIQDWGRVGNTCYKLFNSRVSYASAELSCRRRISGGRLASIHSSGENQVLVGLFPCGVPSAWVGGLYLQQGKSFIWTDGSDINYQNWAPGEPNNINGKEFCMEMYKSGKWNDLFCYTQRVFICEYRLNRSEVQEEEPLETVD